LEDNDFGVEKRECTPMATCPLNNINQIFRTTDRKQARKGKTHS
jgi:hypothetical protein